METPFLWDEKFSPWKNMMINIIKREQIVSNGPKFEKSERKSKWTINFFPNSCKNAYMKLDKMDNNDQVWVSFKFF